MKRTVKLLSIISTTAILVSGVITTLNNNETPSTAQAASITLPAGYTKNAVIKWNQTRRVSKTLINASKKGMKENNYSDAGSDNTLVNVTKLSHSQKVELSRYALSLINSARHQLGKKSWTYKSGALHFADCVANQYYSHNKSCWDADHYVPGIERAAKASGLNSRIGQVYEDEAGLPISSEYHTNMRTMSALKNQIYFNIKQMLFGGFSGSDSQMNDSSRYTEWEHAGDLLGCRTRSYDAKTKYFGISFSGLKSDQSKISVHMMGVAKRYIQNYKKFSH
ncbi:SEC10/PgrA surface exclusion domain-containing protein [Lactobacillus ultunensis]|uniref:SEC10/PgrA surface exclusion domain-containing protein n=1 Tax=Lactobacillus ultunensis TaxID=227945 RepID=UPI0019135323|nr:SEC10/PgrA surface exclusion domain-containing protein [Lactobacillus ultunensis]QQP28758.1 SEC10/PgrA surface exclusion domain-containing protein [Lactobacillus ultunensis]